MELVHARKFFHNTFKVSLNPFLDAELTFFMRKAVIDPCKFDEFLHEKFGNYEEQGMSMQDVLEANYPCEVVAKMFSLLCPEVEV